MNWITKIMFFSQQLLSVYLFDMNGACDEHDKECVNPNLDSVGEITHNKCGKSPALRRIWKSDLLSCVKECKVTSGCVSVSYRRPWNLCDLNTDVNEDNLADEKGCLFTLMSTWPKNLAGDCGTHACGEGQKCVVAGGQITCELAYCVGEPEADNADIVEKFGLYKNLGNGVKYKCHPGFELRGPPLASCQTNGLWHTFFTCFVDECASNPCQNGGICQDGVDEYSCTCRPGFTGDNCQTDINESVSDPCLNDGTCIDGSNMYSCVCRVGYSGTNCETDINECDSSPCQNLGTCHDGLNTYSCSCLLGYAGYNCHRRERLANVTVYVDKDKIIDQMQKCAYFPGPGADGQVITMHCENKPTGFVVLVSTVNGKNPLHLAEVEVYPLDVYTGNLL